MLRLWLFLSALLFAAAEIDVTVHSCFDMRVENVGDDVEFAVSLYENQGGARLIPVLGFESYSDGRLEQRGSCSNLVAGTDAAAIERSASSGQFMSKVTQHQWSRSSSGELATYSRRFSLEELRGCADYTGHPVLHQTGDSFAGTFYISLVQLSRSSDGTVSNFARYVQPHQFVLASDGRVRSVSGMEYMFEIDWIGTTWTPDNEVLVQLNSAVIPLGANTGRFDAASVELVAESGSPLRLMALSDCDQDIVNECHQTWYLHTASLAGSYRLGAQLVASNGPSMLVTAMVSIALEQEEKPAQQRGVEGLIFRDEEMKVPYLSTALDSSSVTEGDSVCVMLQNNEGQEITARAARICSSHDGDLESSSGSTLSGCNTPGATSVVEAVIFDNDRNERSSVFEPVFRSLERASQKAFCFTAKKLSENNHVLEIEYYTEDSETAGGQRGLLSFEWDDRRRCPREMYVDCPSDCSYSRSYGGCQKYNSHYGWGGVTFWWILIILVVVCIGIAACCTGYDGGWYHPAVYGAGYGYGSDDNTAVYSQQTQTHQNAHNTHNTYNYHGPTNNGAYHASSTHNTTKGVYMRGGDDTSSSVDDPPQGPYQRAFSGFQ